VRADSIVDAKSGNIIVGLFNVRSSVRKALDICDLVEEKSLDILVLTETWLQETGDEPVIAELTPAGYSFIHRPRSSGRSGGGVAVIFRDSICVKKCEQKMFASFECMDLVISHGKLTVRTIVLYRPPPSQVNQLTDALFHEEFGKLVSSITNKYLLILGDFNFHWDDQQNRNTRLLTSLFDSSDLRQHVFLPTHRAGHILDWIVSRSDSLKFVQSVTVEDLLLSDHFLVVCETSLIKPSSKRKKMKTRNLKKIDMDGFCSDLSDSELVKHPPDDVEQLVSLYNSTLSSLLDTYAPEVERHVSDRPNTAWFSSSVASAKAVRRRAEKRWRRSGLVVDREIYQCARNQYSQEMRKAKSSYIQSVLEAADSRKMFSVVDRLLGKEVDSPVLPELTEQDAANALSAFFIEKIETIRSGFGDSSDLPHVEPTFVGQPLTCFQPVSEDQLRKIISKANATSSDVDPVPTKIVLACLDILLPVLVKIVNSSLQSASVPVTFKTAVIKPLIKKSSLDPNVCKNFRPISNLPYVSKLLERVVSEQLLSHLNAHALLDKFQSAYRPGHSCETALLRLMNDLLCSADCGDLVLLVLLDLSAAFDVIDHDLLLSRLQNEVGISGVALQWFRSYLSDRTQRVIVGPASSQNTLLSCGVPQGSVLGPILFSLYTCQLGGIIERHGLQRKLFADDSELYKSFHPDPQSTASAVLAVEECCAEVKAWMASNRLKLNDDKTEVILCGSDASREKVVLDSVTVGSSQITPSGSVRDLGLFIDSSLTLVPHISSVVKSCYFYLRSLGKLRPFLNKFTANSVAVALIQSRLDYCNSCLWGLPQNQLQRLQKVQNAAARVVSLTKKTDHITPVLNDLHWLPVQKRIEHKVLSLVFSCIKGCAPAYLKELVQLHAPSRGLRSSSQSLLRVASVERHKKKTFGARSFECVGPQLWNRLPQDLRDCEAVEGFRRRLKTYLFRQ
jgi:hypothetical protein